jgi:hypothetical protein
MSVAVEHRTVSLWPTNGSPVRSTPPLPRQDRATDALAAITSRYRRGRAGIIAGDAAPVSSPPVSSPTVPVAYVPPRAPTAATPADQDDDAPTFWSRHVRSRRPTPRGRHSPKP